MNREEELRRVRDALVPWYRENARILPWREDPTPYHVWVSEIMLQQTRIETVIPYYRRFLSELPDIASLSGAAPEHLEKLWEGLGYYRRVRNLQDAALQIMNEYGGEFPDCYDDIRRLKGIGDYTAGAIASICFGLPEPAVDGNVLRVLARITRDSRPVTEEKTKKEVRKELKAVYSSRDAGCFTEALMELGETVCLPNGVPDCPHCPCRDFCACRSGGWEEYPQKAEKKERRKEDLSVFILSCGDRTALRRRPEKGLLAGMWEFPNCTGHLSKAEAERTASGWDLMPQEVRSAGSYSHVFTHVEWNIQCWLVRCGRESGDFTWADREALRRQISLPRAFRKALDGSGIG